MKLMMIRFDIKFKLSDHPTERFHRFLLMYRFCVCCISSRRHGLRLYCQTSWRTHCNAGGQRHPGHDALISRCGECDALQHHKQDIYVVPVDLVHCSYDHLTCLACILLRSAVKIYLRKTASFCKMTVCLV